jgi:antitoxin component YwqK of YwqJK toxin-antitoxin module
MMKTLKTIVLIAISVIFFLSCQNETNESNKDSTNEIEGKRIALEEKNSLTYEENSNKLANGTYINEIDNYTWVRTYHNGLAHGKHSYLINGNLSSFTNYKNGLLHGELAKFYSDGGGPLLSHFYSEGLIDSTHYYFESGKIQERILFDEFGKRIKWLVYNENGKIVEVKD